LTRASKKRIEASSKKQGTVGRNRAPRGMGCAAKGTRVSHQLSFNIAFECQLTFKGDRALRSLDD
jgi:hypothetical protein